MTQSQRKFSTVTVKDERNSSRDSTVFIVEDDDAARESAAALLESMGYSVRAYSSCEMFLEHADQAVGSCLLLDYRFDGMSGLDLLDRLREREAFIPAVLFTGVFDASIKRRAGEYTEVVAILEKPIGVSPLRHAIRNAFTSLRSPR